MFFEYESAEEAVYMLGGCADGLLEAVYEHTQYIHPPNPAWVARLAVIRRLADKLRAETDKLSAEYERSLDEIP